MDTPSEFKADTPGRTILICDDEALLLGTLARDLTRAGYSVLQARSGESASELLERRAVDLLITDVRLPGMNGWELVSRARATRAKLPVIVMSAFGRGSDAEEPKIGDCCVFLDKPFPMATLRAEVKRALTESRGHSKEARN